MASTAAPYGLRPVRRADGMAYAGSTNTYLIDPAGLASNIFTGQVVHINTSGYLALSTATGADGTTNAFPAGTTLTGSIGVFVGCEYVNAQGQTIHSQYYPSGTTGVVRCKVIDDPAVMFAAQCNGAVAQSKLGENTFFAAAQSTSTGSTATGNSTSALTATTVNTTAAFRIMGFVVVPGRSAIGDNFTDVLVRFNPGYHSLTNAVGL